MNTLPMHNVFNKTFTNHDWYKLVKTNALFYIGKTLAIGTMPINPIVTVGEYHW